MLSRAQHRRKTVPDSLRLGSGYAAELSAFGMAVSCGSQLRLLLLLLMASSSSALLSPHPVNDEVAALVSIKNLLEDPQGVLWTWDPDAVDPCAWTLVSCSTQNLVTSLEAPSQNLSGRLSPSIGNLTNLEILLLPNNHITGTVPPEIGRLGRLRELNLSHNHLYGEIPASLLHLGSLRYIDLSYNNLSGPIPRSFAGTLYVVGNPLFCGEKGQGCSTTAPVPTSNNLKISQASLPTAKRHKFVVAFGSTIACFIFLFFPIS